MKESNVSGWKKIPRSQLSGERRLPVTGWLFNEFDGDQATAVWRRLVN